MPPPFADAARITPYPFVVHQVPDNADASRNTKKKRQRSRADRNPHQEEEVRFNTGPVRYGPSGSRRVSRQPGRSYADAIPDYPPPTFQEAINTGPLSQSSLSLATAPMSSILEDESPSTMPTTRRMEIDPPNEVAPLDDTSESDDSALVIINKNEVPVCSTDFPSPKHDKKDWFKRRRAEVPIASTSTVEKLDDPSLGRKLPRITIPISPDPSRILQGEQSPSSPKRRFLSLSPIKTIFPSKTTPQQDRPLTANSSPSSPKSPLGNRNFFRSTTSLTASSLLRLPGSQKKDSLSRRLFTHKGKEHAREPIVQENLQDNWEVVDQNPEVAHRAEPEDHPQSLMSVVMDSFSANGSTTTFLRSSPTKSKSRSVTPSDESHSAVPASLPNTTNPVTISQIPPPQVESSLEDQKSSDQTDQKSTDTSLSPTPLARTPTASPSQLRAEEPLTSSQGRSTPSATSQRLPTPPPSPPRPSVDVDPQTTEGDVPRHDSETFLQMKPVYQTNHERNTPTVIEELKEKLPPPLVPTAVWGSPAASRSIPDLLSDSDHTLLHSSVCSCGTRHNVNRSFNSVSSPLGMHMYPAYRTPTPPQFSHLTQVPAAEELSTLRPHYAGRPLPRPPPIPDLQGTIINPVLTVNTSPAARKSTGLSDDIRKERRGKEKEGLLIDLEDTSLDTKPLLSPTTTIQSGSDESRYHSQLYLPLISSPSSSAIFTREPLPTELFDMSFSSPSIQSTSTIVLTGTNHSTSCPQHRGQYQHNHRFPYPLSQQKPNGFSKSNLDLPSRFRDGIHDSLQSDIHPHLGYPRDIAGAGSLSHCCSCDRSVMPWAAHSPPLSMPVAHGVYHPQHHHHHHHLAIDNAQRQRHHLAHLSY